MDGAYSTRGKDEKCIRIVFWKYSGKRSFGILWCRWECDVKADIEAGLRMWMNSSGSE
jgi:hypothetical protein